MNTQLFYCLNVLLVTGEGCLRPGGAVPVRASAVWAPRKTTAVAVSSGSLPQWLVCDAVRQEVRTSEREQDKPVRKLLWLFSEPQNDWVLGVFQLLHCWAASTCEYIICRHQWLFRGPFLAPTMYSWHKLFFRYLPSLHIFPVFLNLHARKVGWVWCSCVHFN